MIYRTTVSLFALVGLAACETPNSNTASRADFRAAAADDQFAFGLPFTPADQIPTGSALYEGQIRSDAIVNGDDDFRILGDLALEVDISSTATRDGSGRVGGSITNINLFDNDNDGFDDQEFGGRLTIAGDVDEGRIDALATGNLDAVLADVVSEQNAEWVVGLDGDFVTDDTAGDTVVGNITGGTTNSFSNDYDVGLIGTGRFLGERQ